MSARTKPFRVHARIQYSAGCGGTSMFDSADTAAEALECGKNWLRKATNIAGHWTYLEPVFSIEISEVLP